MAKYDPSMTLTEILGDEEMKAIVLRYMPKVESNPMIGMVKRKNLGQIRRLLPESQMKEDFEKIVAELLAM